MATTRAQTVRDHLVTLAKVDTKKNTDLDAPYSPRSPRVPGCWEVCKNKISFFFCSKVQQNSGGITPKSPQTPRSPGYRSISLTSSIT